MYKIIAKSRYGTEQIDEAETLSEANFLAAEYRLAYGPEFSITIKNMTCTSWLHGKHSEGIEINTRLPYVAINNYFVQGDEAENTINEINEIYNKQDCSVLEAINIWSGYYL